MQSLASYLSDVVGQVFEQNALPANLGVVRVSDRPDLAQFQCNGALAAAKQAKKNPREIAQTIIDALQTHEAIETLEIAGPGFININLTSEFTARFLSEQSQSAIQTEGAKDNTVVLDYGGPNIAKPMHVGHLRSSIIGDALRRIYKAAGYKTLGDVHMGDWGTQMGMIISELEQRGILQNPVTMEALEELYPTAAKACKEDETRMAAAREATRKLQDGDPEYRKAWQGFIDVSINGMKQNFDALGVHFDLWEGEASAHDAIAPMVENLKSQNLAQESDGALVVSVAEETDSKEMPPLILYKSDGAVMYGTTDLATIVKRVTDYNPQKIIYVVDQRQSLHFEQVFRAAQKSNIAPQTTELIHAGFGTMNGTDGKPFKTRAGGVMKLEDLIKMGVERATERLNEADLAADMDDQERADVAKKVALAAIKFADLQNNRSSDYVFDLDRMTAFEGKTGPYLLYQAVRIQSLLKKASGDFENADIILQDEDKKLARTLCEFPDHFENTLKSNAPHILCEYVFNLAQSFSSFYAACHILSEDDEALRASRLRLCQMTCDRIVMVLDLLGISVPARM